MVSQTKQPRASAPAASSRSTSTTTVSKAAKRASLNVKPATSVPGPANLAGDVQPAPIAPQVGPTGSNLAMQARHDHTGPFADHPKFIPSPKKTVVSRKTVKTRPLKKHPKAAKKNNGKPWSEVIQLLTRILFVLFSIYSLFVCPHDPKLQSPVCRGLDYYRRTVVDPYILPPLRAVALHPAVAPQIERVRPYVEQATDVARTQYNLIYDRAVLESQPYVHLAKQQYHARLRPHVRLMEYNLRKYRRQAQPYISLVTTKAIEGWKMAQPVVAPLVHKAQEVPIFLQTFIAKPLEQGKEKWVDPQVRKIVDKVHEMSINAANVSEDKVILNDETAATTGTATFYSSPSELPTASITEQTATVSSSVPPEPTVPEPAVHDPTSSTTLDAATTAATAAPQATETMDPLDQPLYNPNYHDDVEDLDFWQELEEWLSESILTTEIQSTTVTSAIPKPTKLTPEQKAERDRKEKEETAIKRKDIMARHDKWEEQLEALITSKIDTLAEELRKGREVGVKQLQSHRGINRHKTNMELSLNHAVRSTRATLDKMREHWEDRYGEVDEDFADKMPRWAQTLEDLEFAFDKEARKMNDEISNWITVWMKRESEQVASAVAAIKELADKAQADLIGDYAWLNDVTYRDWERYHKLMFRSQEAEEDIGKLFNGKLESKPLPNPINEAMAKLSAETKSITEKYRAGVNKIRQEGWKYLLGDSVSHDKIQRSDPAKVVVPDIPAVEPGFTILPTDPEETGEGIIEGAEAFIGKGKEQVQQAIKQAEEAAAKHEEL